MKTSLLFAAVLSLTLGVSACSDEELVNGGGKTSRNEGDAIKFGVTARDSRTYYGTGDDDDNWKIYWNYGTDKVRIFSNQVNNSNKSYDYTVASSYTEGADNGTYNESGTGTAGVLEESAEEGALKWGKGVDNEGRHHFYAIYPASQTYNVECVNYIDGNDATEKAIFKCPFKTEQTVEVASSATNSVYTATPDMEAQYMFAALDAVRKGSKATDDQLAFAMSPVMTALDVVITRSTDDWSSVPTYITSVEFEVPIPTSMANESAFYECLSANGNAHNLCDKNGAAYTDWSADAKFSCFFVTLLPLHLAELYSVIMS